MSNFGASLRLTRSSLSAQRLGCVVCSYMLYLSTFLRSVHSHHVVSEKLLKELHLGNAEVEIQTAGHINLQRVTTHHHLLERDDEDSKGGNEKREVGGENGKDIKQHIRLVCDLMPRFSLSELLYSSSVYSLSLSLFSLVVPCSPLPSVLSGVPPTACSSNLSLEATSNRISLTNTLG